MLENAALHAFSHAASFFAGAAMAIVLVYWSLVRDKRVVRLKDDEVVISQGYLDRVTLIARNIMKRRADISDEEEFDQISG